MGEIGYAFNNEAENMQTYKNDSWKEKIDPAFDEPIKRYIKYLSEIESLPNDGQITFTDH